MYKVIYKIRNGKTGEVYASVSEIDDVLNISNPDIEIVSVVWIED